MAQTPEVEVSAAVHVSARVRALPLVLCTGLYLWAGPPGTDRHKRKTKTQRTRVEGTLRHITKVSLVI
jgi:hypothetical protein